MANVRLGELLLKAKLLQEDQLKRALAEQQKWGGRLGEILVRMRMVSEDVLVSAISRQLGLPAVNLAAVQTVPPHVLAKVPLHLARDVCAVPLQLRDEGKTLVVAMADPQNLVQLDSLRSVTRCRIIAQLAGRTAIERAIARFYEREEDVEDVDGSFKVLDAQGRTMVRSREEIEAQAQAAATPPPARASAAAASASPAETSLADIHELLRKEVAALRALVELLIEKGVFTREEFVSKLKR